jgi:Flp pilus assembly protein TadD
VRKAQVLKDEGNALVKKGQYQKAVDKYSQSLKLNPTEITTLTNRSVPSTAGPLSVRPLLHHQLC